MCSIWGMVSVPSGKSGYGSDPGARGRRPAGRPGAERHAPVPANAPAARPAASTLRRAGPRAGPWSPGGWVVMWRVPSGRARDRVSRLSPEVSQPPRTTAWPRGEAPQTFQGALASRPQPAAVSWRRVAAGPGKAGHGRRAFREASSMQQRDVRLATAARDDGVRQVRWLTVCLAAAAAACSAALALAFAPFLRVRLGQPGGARPGRGGLRRRGTGRHLARQRITAGPGAGRGARHRRGAGRLRRVLTGD